MKTILPNGTGYNPYKIYINNNDIFVLGAYQNPTTYEVNYYYWKNNVKYDVAQSLGILLNTPIDTNFTMSNFFVKDGDLYIAGLIKNPAPASNHDLYQFCYWKNVVNSSFQTTGISDFCIYLYYRQWCLCAFRKNIINTPMINWGLGYYKNGIYHFVNNLSNCVRIIEENGNVLMQINVRLIIQNTTKILLQEL